MAQGIYASPVEPAGARGLLRFDIGLAATAVPVDTNAEYWQRSVADDFSVSDHVAVPRLIVSKGLSVVTVAASYAKIPDTDVAVWGASMDVPIMDGGVVKPTLSLRAAYAQLDGIEHFKMKTYGAEVFLSKGFGPITPYIGAGRMRSDAEGMITGVITAIPLEPLIDKADFNRYTVGVRISLLLPKLVIEATQAEERTYAAKVSFGL